MKREQNRDGTSAHLHLRLKALLSGAYREYIDIHISSFQCVIGHCILLWVVFFSLSLSSLATFWRWCGAQNWNTLYPKWTIIELLKSKYNKLSDALHTQRCLIHTSHTRRATCFYFIFSFFFFFSSSRCGLAFIWFFFSFNSVVVVFFMWRLSCAMMRLICEGETTKTKHRHFTLFYSIAKKPDFSIMFDTNQKGFIQTRHATNKHTHAHTVDV